MGGVALLILGCAVAIAFGVQQQRRADRHKTALVQLTQLSSSVVASADQNAKHEELRSRIAAAVASIQSTSDAHLLDVDSDRFTTGVRDIIFGHAEEAALGIDAFLRVRPAALRGVMANGVGAIIQEVSAAGSDVMKECLDYVLHQRAGCSEKLFPNSPHARDCDSYGVRKDRLTPDGTGMRFEDFVSHETSQRAGLQPEHVLGLRLYTTAAFAELNTPLRIIASDPHAPPHPFPATIKFIAEGIKQLRSVGADRRGPVELWRGLRNLNVDSDGEFTELGGTEIAPMSTTTSLEVAIKYSASASSVLLKLTTSSFMQRGADLGYLSAFPSEAEVLYPPLTFLEPLRNQAFEIELEGGLRYKVIEVEPHIGS